MTVGNICDLVKLLTYIGGIFVFRACVSVSNLIIIQEKNTFLCWQSEFVYVMLMKGLKKTLTPLKNTFMLDKSDFQNEPQEL